MLKMDLTIKSNGFPAELISKMVKVVRDYYGSVDIDIETEKEKRGTIELDKEYSIIKLTKEDAYY